MAEYVPPQERPVVRIDHPILTPQQEQGKWLAEGIQAVKDKSVLMQACMASTTAEGSAKTRREGGRAAEEGSHRGKTTSNSGGFMSVVRAAAAMLDELRVGTLAPHNYYEVYITVFDQMQVFTQYVAEEHTLRQRSLEEMYEAVQYVGHILPRLYMLIAVGSVFMSSGDAPALALFQDLVEMCKGVQHPTRGLFLRHFLLNMTKNLLPGDMNRAKPNDASADGGTALDTANLLVQNAREMNWLWIRMEAKWYGRDLQSVYGAKENAALSARRTQSDRKELRVLVGMNVVRISQLDGIDAEMYRDVVLPQLIKVVLNYREPVAQQYLFEVIVQVFPDEFHVLTLDTLLQAVRYLTNTVDVCELLRSLMERLGNYVVALREGRTETPQAKSAQEVADNMFSVLLEKLEQMPVSYSSNVQELREIKRSSSLPPVNPILLVAYVNAMASLVRMAVKVAPGNCADNISAVLQCVADKFASAPTVAKVITDEWEAGQAAKGAAHSRQSSPAQEDSGRGHKRAGMPELPAGATTMPAVTVAAITAAERLIASTTEHMGSDLAGLLSMDGLASLIGQLPFRGRRAAAIAMCDSALKSAGAHKISSLDGVSRLFEIMDPMLCDQDDAPEDPALIYTYDPQAEFIEEQQTVCRVLHLIDNKDPVGYVKMLNGVRKLLGQGGPERVPRTFPTLASLYTRAALRLYVALKDAEFAVEEERIAAQAAKYKDPTKAVGGRDAEAGEDEKAHGDADGGEEEEGPPEEPEDAEAGGKKKKKSKKKSAADEDDDGGNGGEEGAADPKKRVQQLSKQLSKVFKYLYSSDGKGILEILAACDTTPSPTATTAFYAYLTAANTADTCEMADVCYDLFGESFSLYEAHAADTREQIDMLVSIINAVYATKHLPAESYSTLAIKACRHCSQLMKKSDQSRMVALCANLFAKKRGGKSGADTEKAEEAAAKKAKKKSKDEAPEEGEVEEEGGNNGTAEAAAEEPAGPEGESTNAAAVGEEDEREVVLECLQRALKMAKTIAHPLQQLALYVDLLNILLHFYASKTVRLEASYVNSTLDTIRTLSEAQRDGESNAKESSSHTAADSKEKAKAQIGGSDEDEEDGDSDAETIGKQRTTNKRRAAAAAAAEADSQEAANFTATYDAIRQVYRATTKYIRSRQSVDPRWEEIEV